MARGLIARDLPYSDKALGCAMSHISLWQQATERECSLTIFEDDIVISRQFEPRAREIIASLEPVWDFIQWGHVINPLFSWVDIGISKIRLHNYGARRYDWQEGWRDFQEQEFIAAPLKLLHSFGTQGYSISPKGARKMLEYALPLRDRLIEFYEAGVATPDVGIDVTLCGIYPEMKAFTCIPPLLIHHDDQHNVRGEIEAPKVIETECSAEAV